MTPQIQETVATAANKVTGAGSATTIVSWIIGSDFGVWTGIAIGLVGLAINFYYRRKSDLRAIEAHEIYMRSHSRDVPAETLPPTQEARITETLL